MAFQMREGESVGEGVRRIACEQIDAGIAEIAEGTLPRPVKIHQVRKRCKKLRALLRLVRPGLGTRYAQENEYYRDAARLLSPLRDAQSVLDAYDGLMTRFAGDVARATYAPVRRRLVQRKRQAAHDAAELGQRLDEVRNLFRDGREHVATWPIEAGGADAWRDGFERTYRQARRAMRDAFEGATAAHFHEWRKHVKYHWYHARLLRPLWDRDLSARARTADALGELLGQHHDLAVLRASFVDADSALGGRRQLSSLVELIDRRRIELEAEARPLGARLFAEKGAQLVRRHVQYWDAWQEEQRCRQGHGEQAVAVSA